jgi:hypothetical protein
MTTIRQRVADRLRTIGPVPVERIWGRAKNLPVHDAKAYLDEETDGGPHKQAAVFDPDSLGPEGNVWAGSPEDVAELLDDEGLLASDGEQALIGYMVIREIKFEDWVSRDSVGSTIMESREKAEQYLAQWSGWVKRFDGDRFTERLFVAELREVPE